MTFSLQDTNLNTKRKVKRGGKVYIQDTTNIGKAKQTESQPADEVISDREVTNLEKNTPTKEVVNTAKTDEVNNYDDTAVDNEETDVQADFNPKQSIICICFKRDKNSKN